MKPVVNIHAEKAVLGAVLGSADAYWSVSDRLRAEHFSSDLHQKIFSVIAEICDEGKRLVPSLVCGRLPPITDGVAIESTIGILLQEGEEAGVPLDFVDDIIAAWQERKFASVAETARKLSANPTIDMRKRLAELQGGIEAIEAEFTTSRLTSFAEAADRSIENTAEAYRTYGKVHAGIRTGIQELDEMVGPIMPPSVVTLLAPSGHGKTALITQILKAAGTATTMSMPTPSLFMSMEMRAEDIARRILAGDTSIATRRQRAGEIEEYEFAKLQEARNYWRGLPIYFDDRGRVTAREIAKSARRAKRMHGIKILAIDHLKLLEPEKESWNPVETIQRALPIFQALAKELDLIIFLLAQITREGQKREGWRVRERDTYGGEDIKEASDLMIAAVQPHEWLKQNEPESEGEKNKAIHDAWLGKLARWKDKAEVGALKVRDGVGGEWRELPFDGNRLLFGSGGG